MTRPTSSPYKQASQSFQHKLPYLCNSKIHPHNTGNTATMLCLATWLSEDSSNRTLSSLPPSSASSSPSSATFLNNPFPSDTPAMSPAPEPQAVLPPPPPVQVHMMDNNNSQWKETKMETSHQGNSCARLITKLMIAISLVKNER